MTRQTGFTQDDWERIKAEYIATRVSSRELAKKYGISESYMRAKRTKGKWDEEREKLARAKADAAIKAAAKVQGDLVKLATETLEVTMKKLHVAADTCDPNDVRTLKDIADAMTKIKELGMYEVKKASNDVQVTFESEGSSYAD